MICRQHEGSGLESVAMNGHTGALELIAVVIPKLGHSAFGLELIRRLASVDSVDVA